MKIEQTKPPFNPVSIVLETCEEAEIFWNVVEQLYPQFPHGSPERKMLISISNALSTKIHF